MLCRQREGLPAPSVVHRALIQAFDVPGHLPDTCCTEVTDRHKTCALERLVVWWGGGSCRQTVPTRAQTRGLHGSEAASHGDSVTASMPHIITLTLTLDFDSTSQRAP